MTIACRSIAVRTGSGCWRRSDCETISDAILFTTSPHLFKGSEEVRYRTIEQRARLFRYGCDCYAYALLAAGHIDLVVENSLKPYDVGGIIPVVEQAGGVMTTWDGCATGNGRHDRGRRYAEAACRGAGDPQRAVISLEHSRSSRGML